MRVSGEGDMGTKGGGPGDLYVVMHVQEDETGTFDRRGNDVYVEVPLAYHQVALGDEVEVPTLEGTTNLNIPAGTQPGKMFTLKGKGVPVLGTDGRRRGELHIIVNIEVPKKLGAEETKLLKELASITKGNSTEKQHSNKNNSNEHSFINILKNALHRDK